jgi:tetratricopeptide (TPR) repeat protein
MLAREKEDAGLVALTWAWFLERTNRSEYGLSAGQGMLWEEAGYPGYASRRFDEFLKTHAVRKEARYDNLAAWVRNQRIESGQEFSFAKEDPAYLEAQAELRRTQGKYAEAEELMNKAIALEPNNVRLYFDHMNILYDRASEAGKQADDKAKQEERRLYQQVISDCNRVLKLQEVPDAYYFRGMANHFLGKPKEGIRDLKLAIKLAPTHQYAIEELGYLMEETSPEHPEEAAEWFTKYDRIFPGANAEILAQLSDLQIKMKQFANAYYTIQKALALDPANYSYYQTRAKAEEGLGYSEAQIQRDCAEGDRVATEFLRRSGGDPNAASSLERDRWKLLSDMGDKFSNEQVRCNSDVTTCVAFRVTHDHGETAFLKIASIQAPHPDWPIVKIDRGANDGVVLGSTGDVYSPPSEDKNHERKAARIGSAEVLSVEPQTALLRVKVSNPKGDGMVRAGDAVALTVRTPPVAERSKLWPVLKYSIALLDLKGQKIADFRTLYSEESPELDRAIYQKLLDDIHETGRLHGDELQEGDSISIAGFADHRKRLRQVLEETTREDLDNFFEYFIRFPANYFGHDWKIGLIYADWVKRVMPEN